MDNLLPLSKSKQALAMFEELKFLAGDSPYVFPNRHDYRRPLSNTTLNCAVRTLDLNVRDLLFMTSGVLPAHCYISRATTRIG